MWEIQRVKQWSVLYKRIGKRPTYQIRRITNAYLNSAFLVCYFKWNILIPRYCYRL